MMSRINSTNGSFIDWICSDGIAVVWYVQLCFLISLKQLDSLFHGMFKVDLLFGLCSYVTTLKYNIVVVTHDFVLQ